MMENMEAKRIIDDVKDMEKVENKEATITVRNRRLEQALFYLGVDHLSCWKDEEDLPVWVYPATDKTLTIVKWFKEATATRKKAGW